MPSSTPIAMTAAQRVLSTPELLGEILKWYGDSPIHRDNPCKCPWPSDFAFLIQLALVNSLWFLECMRLVWEKPRKLNASPFSHLAPARRQVYANFIRLFCLRIGPKHRGWMTRQKRIFKDLVLHNATLAFMQVLSNIENLYIPPVEAPALNSLCIYVCGVSDREGSSSLGHERSYKLARRIKELFPSIRRLFFTVDSNLGPGCFEIFVEEFPGVEIATDMKMGHYWGF